MRCITSTKDKQRQFLVDKKGQSLPPLVCIVGFSGVGKLPAIGAGVGKAIRNFKNAATESDKIPKKKCNRSHASLIVARAI